MGKAPLRTSNIAVTEIVRKEKGALSSYEKYKPLVSEKVLKNLLFPTF